jgi:hypothetical protein
MELFQPSKKLLDTICNEDTRPLSYYEVYLYDTPRNMEELLLLHHVGVVVKLYNFYARELNGDKNRLDIQGIYDVSGELFKNWTDHAPLNSTLVFGLYLGSKGVCYGFNDGGDFFKDIEIKNIIENKIPFTKFIDLEKDTCQCGFIDIYRSSDLLEVDNVTGTIYAVQLKENIIAPEGENGSAYCWKKRENNLLKT